jgi:hypothetical protein
MEFLEVWGSSSARPLKVGSKCIKPDLSSKFTLLSIFMHNGWFSMLGVASSLSVCYRVTAMALRRDSFHNLCKVFSISWSNCTWLWLVKRVTGINHQENSKETNHTRDRKQCKLYENLTVENKNCLKTLENSGIWPQYGGASGKPLVLFRTSFPFRKQKADT